MVNPEVITFCLSWGLMEQKLKLFRLETIPEVAVRVKYNSFAACLLRLLLTSSGPAAGQQLRRRRRCPRPRAPRKGSRGSGRRFRAALPGRMEPPPQPRPSRPGAQALGGPVVTAVASPGARGGRPLGRGCPPCWFGSKAPSRPPQLQEEAARPRSPSDGPRGGLALLARVRPSSPHPGARCGRGLPRPCSPGEGLLWKQAFCKEPHVCVSSGVGLATAGCSPGERCLEQS